MTTEYNKIHALAQARKKIVQKFGDKLEDFWPLADPGSLVHDLVRRKTLYGMGGISVQEAGLLDYAIRTGTGYISDRVANIGHVNFGTYDAVAGWAIEVPAGVWAKFAARVSDSNGPFVYYVAPTNLTPAEVEQQYIDTWQWAAGVGYEERSFPCPLVADDGQYWVYCKRSTGWTATGNSWKTNYPATYSDPVDQYGWSGSAWVKNYNSQQDRWIKFLGQNDAENWPATAKLTVLAAVDADKVDLGGSGTIVSLSDDSTARVKLRLGSDRKVAGVVIPSTGSHTLTSPRRLHPGFNLVSVSYENGAAVKLGVNGKIVASEAANAYNVLGATLCVGIGADVTTGGTVTNQLRDAVIDDVFIATDVLTDADLWAVYLAYITAAPLMLVEEQAST